ncbi:hypothetical protein MUK42_01725 [Musa troglodytarum]|uniref:Uncharacterized protein n=1 Tax=Musa troglodytarum TaxID=320322 RepID=A0A9E7FED4_9LILI|nr:hypothetical protein MUK42_01725 [Musa troglodytarum]URD93622.1 hypothetical protein MUK42_01725 [Musa troglodytarum]
MGDLETPSDIHHKSLDTVETCMGERGCRASGLKAKLKQFLEFSVIATVINFATVLSLLLAHPHLQGHVSSFRLVICEFLAFSSLVCGIILMPFIQYLLSHENPRVQRGHYKAASFLVFISCALLVSTSASFFTLLHEHSIFLVALLPLCLLLSTIFYIIMPADDDQGATGYEDNKSELKQSFRLSSNVVSLAFAGLVSTLIGIIKTSSEQAPTTNVSQIGIVVEVLHVKM